MIRYLFILISLFILNSAKSQGDVCIGATTIICGQTVTGNTAPFTSDIVLPCVVSDGTGGGVWYRFSGTGTIVTASLCGSSYDTMIRIYSGDCNNLLCVSGNDDFCNLQSQVSWTSTLGTTYFILVHGYNSSVGSYALSLTCANPMCYTQTPISYTPDSYVSGTPLILDDDTHSGIVPIGFNFCYNDNTYSQCVISPNNYITFNISNAGTFSPYTTNAVPSVTPIAIQNSILNPWHDTNPSTGGSIKYQTLGVPPYRRFVVSFLDVPMFSCNSLLVTNQLILYESTNCIASFMLNKPICYTWNSGNAVHALQNGNGLSATIVAGRNNTQWTTSSQGILFSPTCVPCSTSTTSQCATLLPIELIQFDGYSEGTSNILEWSTASEQNSDIFILERSEDGENFIPLDVVDAAGNSTSTIKYRSIDSNPIIGMNYYRLRNLDIDGTGDLSNVIAILFNPNEYKREFSLNNLNFPSCVYLS